jgi:hypothetical protein
MPTTSKQWVGVHENDKCYCMDLETCTEMEDHPCHDESCKFCRGTGKRWTQAREED